MVQKAADILERRIRLSKHDVWQTKRLHQYDYSTFKKSPFEDVQEILNIFVIAAFITPVRVF